MKDLVRRIGGEFDKELKEIANKREEKGREKMYRGKITNLITKHNSWSLIKEDLIKFNPKKRKNILQNKKGLTTISLFLFVFAALLIIIFLGIAVFMFNTISTNLDIDEDFGQVNLKDVNALTFGRINQAFLDSADYIGFTILFSLVLLMFLNAYFLRGEYPRLFLIIDIVLLVFAYILSVYISETYSLLINSTSLLSNIYINMMPKSSAFILNLPNIIGIIGCIIMILSYSGMPRKKKEISLYG